MTSSTAVNGHVPDTLAPLGLTPHSADRQHARRLNRRLVAGLVCVVAAFSGFLVFAVASSPRTHGVVVAARDLPAGARLRRADLAIVQAQLGESQAQAFIAGEDVGGLEGQELLAPAGAQQMLARNQVGGSRRPVLGPGFVRMTVPVRPDTAVGGALRPGDVVTVLATGDKGKATAQTRPVLERVIVDQVGQADSLTTTGVGNASDNGSVSLAARAARPVAWVTLLVPEGRATSLSLARWTDDLELIQLPPTDPATAAQ